VSVVDLEVREGPVDALRALFGTVVPAGEALPPLWHWAALARWAPAEATGTDGHPVTPESEVWRGRRRMFVGGSVELLAPLAVGTTVRVERRIVSEVDKQGRQGPFSLVTVENRIVDHRGEPAVVERQQLVYRVPAPVDATPAKGGVSPVVAALLEKRADWHWRFASDPTKLMRFSAATSNGHRVHYDWPYATGVEGYPGLLVHGPLMTMALAEVFRVQEPDAVVARVTHRNHRPLFCGEPATITSTRSGAVRTLTLAASSTPDIATTTVEITT